MTNPPAAKDYVKLDLLQKAKKTLKSSDGCKQP